MHTRNEQARPCVYLCQVQKSDVKLKLKLLKLFKIFQGICGTSSPGLATNSIFFLFRFCKKSSLICLGGQSMASCWVFYFFRLLFSAVLPGNFLLSVSAPEGLFELTQCPSGPSTCLVHSFRNYRDIRTLSGVPRLAQGSQDTIKNN